MVSVFITTQCFAPATGGIEGYMTAFARALATTGIAVTVFADGKPCAEDTELAQAGIIVHRFFGPKPLRRHKKARAIHRAWRHCPNASILADTWKSLEHITVPGGNICVCLAHGMEFPDSAGGKKQVRIKTALQQATHILANSRYTADKVQPFTQDPAIIGVFTPPLVPLSVPSAHAIATYGQRIGLIRPNAPDSEQRVGPVLCSLGRLEPRKGFDQVIRALVSLRRTFPHLRYIIGGSGDDEARLKRLAQATGVMDCVHFTGPIDDAHKAAFLSQGDVFVMPARAEGASVEGFGMVYQEAGLMGVPAIGGTAGGAGDAITEGVSGLLVDGTDTSAVEGAIRTLLTDAPLRQTMQETAHRLAQHNLWQHKIATFQTQTGINSPVNSQSQ